MILEKKFETQKKLPVLYFDGTKRKKKAKFDIRVENNEASLKCSLMVISSNPHLYSILISL